MVSTNGTGLKQSPKEQRHEKRRKARLEAHLDRQNLDPVLIEFQPDAVELEKQPVPGGARWTLYVCITLILSAIGWSYWAKVDRIVVAEGKLITSVSPIMIDAKLAAPIRTINVKFGDRVKVGQVLATLDPTVSDADVDLLKTKRDLLLALQSRLMAEKEEREFDISGHETDRDWVVQYQLFQRRKEAYTAKIREFQAEQSKLKVTQANNEEAIKFLKTSYLDFKEYEERIKRLREKGSASEEDMLARRLQSNESEMKYQDAVNRKAELIEEVEALRTRLEAFIADERSRVMMDLVDTHEKLVEVRQELQKAVQAQSFVNVTVPDSLGYSEFVVFEVAEQAIGTIMQPGQPLFKLVPLDVPLDVEIEVFGKDIALIREVNPANLESGEFPPGSDVRVKLASYPFQRHGTLKAVVRTISEDTFEKEQTPGNPAMTAYRVRLQLVEPIELENVNENFRLIPGMATTAEIKVGNRRVIEYFLYPLIRYLDRSIREP